MFSDKEFPRFFVDARAAESALFTKSKERVAKALKDREKGVKLLQRIDELLFDTHATLPAEANARISASENGYVTIVITDLTSFHDVQEVVNILFDEFSGIYQEEPYTYDIPASKAREFSFGYSIPLSLRAVLDAERAECKVVVVGTRAIPAQETELDRKILCPGDPRYDDY